jgi:hypothetical protein
MRITVGDAKNLTMILIYQGRVKMITKNPGDVVLVRMVVDECRYTKNGVFYSVVPASKLNIFSIVVPEGDICHDQL